MKKRGVSAGTVLIILLTLAVSAGCFVVLPKLSGGQPLQIDAQQVVSALSRDLSLPELRLSDIPIFSSGPAQPQPTVSAPAAGMEHLSQSTHSPAPVQTLAPTSTPAPQSVSFTLTAGGSIHLPAAIRKSVYHSESKTYDYSELFAHVSHEIQSDLCLVTLESTMDDQSKLSDLNVTSDAKESLLTLSADLVAAGFPKALDTGTDAFHRTLNTLKQEGFSVIGAYETQEARKPLILNLKGAQTAVLHYTQELSSKGKSALKKADAAYSVPLLDLETVQADIAAARQNGAQVVILSLNWGSVGKTAPTKAQKELAQELANAGADIILGAHSQTVQPVEYLTATRPDGSSHQTLVAYSLGALMTQERDTKYIGGMLLQLHLSYHPQSGTLSFDQVEYTPTYIWRFKEEGQYRYRLIASDQPAPDGMDESQQKVMTKILNYTTTALEGSPIAIR